MGKNSVQSLTMGESERPSESRFRHYAESVPPFAWGEPVQIPSDLEVARTVQAQIEAEIRRAGWMGEQELFNFKTALEEAMVDAIKHGNQCDRSKQVTVRWVVSQKHVAVAITDEGEGFDPFEVPDPAAPENIERPCGRGLLLINEYTSGWRYDNITKTLTMWKRKSGIEASSSPSGMQRLLLVVRRMFRIVFRS
jgi:serine/threonine-protein kinase RsbW